MARATALALGLAIGPAVAQEAPREPLLPRLEVGIGGLAMGLPDYRGSDYYAPRVFPIPYIVYRSPTLQVTRDGVRARLLSLERLTLTVSAAIGVPGNDDNPDRAGMEELDPTLEIGPALDYVLAERRGGAFKTRLRVPVRGVAAADGLRLRKVGWTTTPHLRMEWIDLSLDWSKFHFLSLGPVWSSESYHDYFYEVDPAEALPDRPAYDAESGYSGVRFGLSSAMVKQRWRAGLFMSYDYLGGASFDDSPLVKTDHSVSGGIYVAYRIYASGAARPLEEEKP